MLDSAIAQMMRSALFPSCFETEFDGISGAFRKINLNGLYVMGLFFTAKPQASKPR